MRLTEQWIEAFRAGNYGDKGTYTISDLDAIAASYNPQVHEAPVVIGHPNDNSPAVGWVERVKRDADRLFVQLRQVRPEFEDMVKRGLFKKRSVSIYPSFSRTGKPYLRHVGFLGAMPPEVKGLADISFAGDGRCPTIELCFDDAPIARPALHFNATPGIGIDRRSVARMERAQRYAADHGVNFGDALRAVWTEVES